MYIFGFGKLGLLCYIFMPAVVGAEKNTLGRRESGIVDNTKLAARRQAEKRKHNEI